MFGLRTVTHERLKDSQGRLMPTVVASHLSPEGQQEIEKAARSREDQLLTLLAKLEGRGASQRELASQLGWFMGKGVRYQMLVSRTLSALKKEKLIAIVRDSIELTPAGRKYVEGIKSVEGTKSSVKKRTARKRRRASRASKPKPLSNMETQVGRKRDCRARTQKVAVSISDNSPSETGG